MQTKMIKYRVDTVEGIAQIPPERLPLFMKEFPQLVEMQQHYNQQMQILPKVIRRFMPKPPMYWIDDGRPIEKQGIGFLPIRRRDETT